MLLPGRGVSRHWDQIRSIRKGDESKFVSIWPDKDSALQVRVSCMAWMGPSFVRVIVQPRYPDEVKRSFNVFLMHRMSRDLSRSCVVGAKTKQP